MKLKDVELAVMSAVLFDADLPIASLARDSGITPSTARATLTKLKEEQILRYYPFINVYPMGYIPYQFYFTPVAAKEEAIKTYLFNHQSVSWLIQASGPYKFCAVMLCKTPFEFLAILQEMGTRLGAVFVHRATALQTAHTMTKPMALFPRDKNYREITWQSLESKSGEIDTVDRRILSGLLNCRYESRRDLSRQLDIASSTFSERIKWLCDQKIITGFVYAINFAKLGYHSYKILVTAKTPHTKFRAELKNLVRHEPNTYAFTECIGPWDYEIDLRCPEESTPQRFIKAIQAHFGALLGAVEIVKFEQRIKMSCYPFLDEKIK